MNDINYLFAKYQKPLVDGLNNWALGTPFRKLLGIDKECKDRIYKLYDNSYHTRLGKNKFQATIRSYPLFAKRIGVALSKWDIVKEYITRNPKLYFGLDEYRGLLAEIGLLNTREFPTVMAASPETIYVSAGDGKCRKTDSTNWTTTREATTAEAADYTSTPLWLTNTNIVGGKYFLYRAFYPFDTSALPAGFTVTAGTLSIYITAATNTQAGHFCIVQSTQASLTELVVGDFDGITLNTPDEGITRVSVGALGVGALNNFTLNDNGEGWIGASTAKFCARGSHDIDNTTPTAACNVRGEFSEATGTDKDPKLVVTYTAGGGGANAGWKSLLGVGL